jgi:hypothetical protein
MPSAYELPGVGDVRPAGRVPCNLISRSTAGPSRVPQPSDPERLLRLQAHPTHRPAPGLVVAVASVPVLAQIYATEARRHLESVRPAVLVAFVLLASLAASQLAGPSATAGPSFAYQPLPADGFRPVVMPVNAGAGALDEAAMRIRPPNLTTGLTRAVSATAVGHAPAVVRFRPRPGQAGISTFAALSVRFTRPMDHRSTERAFGAKVAGKLVVGRYVWAEHDTVLVLIPRHPLGYGVKVKLGVTSGARSADGQAIDRTAAATFRVISRPKTPDNSTRSAHSTAPRRTSSGWIWPLIGPITQYFGQHLTEYGFHQGIDINGETGDPVLAARSGRVLVAGHWDSCGGLQVHIDHGNGLES